MKEKTKKELDEKIPVTRATKEKLHWEEEKVKNNETGEVMVLAKTLILGQPTIKRRL